MRNPAKLLKGRILSGEWRVLKPIEKPSHATGGHFSQCYLVESTKDGTKAFLKALDYSKALESPDPARALQAMTEAYNFERDLLAKCKAKNMDRVVRALADGGIKIEGADAGGVVQYLIMELADRDIRSQLALSQQVDLAWKLRSLHHIATGMKQLHTGGIAHQDLKPSNVLVFEEAVSKVADLGTASAMATPSLNDELVFAGDWSYAPPELWYQHIDPDWKKRRLGVDVYLLGSMVIFFFVGLSATGMLISELHENHRPEAWTQSFREVLPYLQEGFGRMIDTFCSEIPEEGLCDPVREIVYQLCNPDPDQRGVPARIRGIESQYLLERYVSKFDLLARRAELKLFRR